MSPKPKAERSVKTPAQRAEEALGVARRAAAKSAEKLIKARGEIAALEAAVVADRKRLDYLAGNPDLPEEVAAESRAWLEQSALEEAPVDVQPV
jgi:hypothetical protein